MSFLWFYSLTSVSGAALTSVGGSAIAFGGTGLLAPPQYRLLEDHWINQDYLPASTVVSENDFLPEYWVPTPNVDPLNTGAVQNFYAEGPTILGLVRTQFSSLAFSGPPVTYWKQVSPNLYALTGLGAGLSPVEGV